MDARRRMREPCGGFYLFERFSGTRATGMGPGAFTSDRKMRRKQNPQQPAEQMSGGDPPVLFMISDLRIPSVNTLLPDSTLR